MRRLTLLLLALIMLVVPASAGALPGKKVSAKRYVQPASYPGLQHKHYEFGPVKINPGQNVIEFQVNKLKPQVPGYITRFSPGLVYAKNHKTPRVDVIHLHHGVWLIGKPLQPTFAAGEEKTKVIFPQGYGFHHDPKTPWLMNHMIHNLTPTPTKVYITYDIDFVPDTAPAAKTITPVKPLWMDVAGIRAYPVFDAVRGKGHKGKYTFPRDADAVQARKVGAAQKFTAPRDLTLINTAGHLHPGGLHNDLYSTRAGKRKRVFRSVAKYFEPAGAVSWDVSMTGTKRNWRVAVHKGDTLSTTVTYDVHKASWYESMGIMVSFYAEGIRPGAKDPFKTKIDTRGLLTHGHLAENDNHGGQVLGLPNPMGVLSGTVTKTVDIEKFSYGRGDLSNGKRSRLPVVRPGKSLTFTNLDSIAGSNPRTAAYHTITACRTPCNRTAGIAYPVANAKPGVNFDSGELGYGPGYATPAANRNTWKTPKNLPKGTYSYFCRVHPFMRGAFRVKGKA